MLQDAIWADAAKLASDPAYQRHGGRSSSTASLQGLGVLPRQPRGVRATSSSRKGSKLGASHQLWQMNEINKLIWPAPDGVGMIDQAAWDRTVEIAHGHEEPRRRRPC